MIKNTIHPCCYLLFRLKNYSAVYRWCLTSPYQGTGIFPGRDAHDRQPARCPAGYLWELKEEFGEATAEPMTLNGARGLSIQTKIGDPYPLDLVKDLFGTDIGETKYVLHLAFI
jgi:hypothetical protein